MRDKRDKHYIEWCDEKDGGNYLDHARIKFYSNICNFAKQNSQTVRYVLFLSV